MKVGEPESRTLPPPTVRRVGAAVLLLLVFVTGLAAGDLGLHRKLAILIRGTLARIETAARREQLPTLNVDMDFADYRVLLQQREMALEKGIYLSADDAVVPAKVRLGSDAAEVQVQLREGPSDNLDVDDKWPLAVQVTSETLLGPLPFRQFTLQDPADNNWLMQWAFAEALRREGFLAPRCVFVRLVLNGSYRGIYAVQEGLGEAFLTAQGRPAGVIIGFDTAPLWQAVAHFGGSPDAALADPVSNLSLHDFRTIGVKTLQYDASPDLPELEDQREAAIAVLYALQTGRRRPEDVFDLATYGRFLALVDLWAAPEATALTNLRYYYDAASHLLQPIVTNGNPLATDERLVLQATYGDPLLQRAYVKEAGRVSNADYLLDLRQDLQPSWHRLSAAMADELPDPTPPWDRLAQRQAVLQQSLAPIQPILAYVLPGSGAAFNILNIDVANRLGLPIEVLGFDIGSATFIEANADQVAANASEVLAGIGDGVTLRAAGRDDTDLVQYARFALRLEAIQMVDSEAAMDQETTISVAVRLLGAERVQLVPATTGVPQQLMP